MAAGPPPSSLALTRDIVFHTIGGVGLLIYGVHLLGEGLQKAAGDRLRRILGAFTSNPVKGVCLGALATAIVQSSSATTVMLVGFVNAGLMTLQQALGVVFGANIGTTITVKMAAFELDQYALPAIGIGLGMNLFAKRKLVKNLGLGLLGFGILFLGICVLKEGVSSIKESPRLLDALQWGAERPIIGLVIAMLLTALVQSSSATTVMVLTLATQGLLGDASKPDVVLHNVLPLVLGCNIGTCITAFLASIGANIVAKRVVVAHIIFNVLGSTWVMIALPLFVRIVLWTSRSHEIGQLVANSHIAFNMINAIVFLFFTKYYAQLLVEIVPGEPPKPSRLQHLDDRLLNAPSLAIEAGESELVNMAEISRDMMRRAMKGFFDKDREALDTVTEEEDTVDQMQKAITEYVVRVSEQDLSHEQSEKLPPLIHAVNDIERTGDHAENLVELARAKLEEKLKFSKKAAAELREMFHLVDAMFGQAIEALRDNDPSKAALVLQSEEKVNELDKALRGNHIDRLKSRKCKVETGVIFLDMLTNFEKIGDHLTNVAQAVGDALQWNGVHLSDVEQEAAAQQEDVEEEPAEAGEQGEDNSSQ